MPSTAPKTSATQAPPVAGITPSSAPPKHKTNDAPPFRSVQEMYPEWFHRKVDKSFYETEEQLGPLPKGWEMSVIDNQRFFINHNEQKTTWVDPRTARTREKDIRKIKPGQLPYGWDEAVDPEIGVYYIDHNTQTTYLDPPWDDFVRFQAMQLQEFITGHAPIVNNYEEAARNPTSPAITSEAEKRLQKLQEKQEKLITKLAQLRELESTGVNNKSEQEDLLFDLEDNEEQIRMEKLIISGDTEAIAHEVNAFKHRMQELARINDRLRSQGRDELKEAMEARKQMEKLRSELDEEMQEREHLESEIMNLKTQLEGGSPAQSVSRPVIALPPPIVTSAPPASSLASESGRRKTRYDMEVELLMLKKRLQEERSQRDRLAQLKATLEEAQEATSPGQKPEWIKKLQEIASNSQTLRIQINRKAQTNPDKLSFRERMLLYTSGAVEEEKHGLTPPKPDAQKPPPVATKPAYLGRVRT